MKQTPILVMLIDDDSIQNMLSEAVIKMVSVDIEVVIFEAVREALDYLKSDAPVPNIILVDINMPYLSGWDFVSEFNKLGLRKLDQCAINMLTSSDHEKDMEKASEYEHIMSYTSKPMTKEDFEEICNFYVNDFAVNKS